MRIKIYFFTYFFRGNGLKILGDYLGRVKYKTKMEFEVFVSWTFFYLEGGEEGGHYLLKLQGPLQTHVIVKIG